MPSSRELFEEIKKADSAGYIALTRHLREEFLSRKPDIGPVLIMYASDLIDLHLYDKAAMVLNRAEKVVPKEKLHLVVAERGHLYEAKGEFEEAENQFLSAYKLRPDEATDLIYAACVAFRKGDLHRAEEHARLATKCSEGCLDEAFFNLGGILMAQKKYSEARHCYLEALEIDPDYKEARLRLDDLECLLKKTG